MMVPSRRTTIPVAMKMATALMGFKWSGAHQSVVHTPSELGPAVGKLGRSFGGIIQKLNSL